MFCFGMIVLIYNLNSIEFIAINYRKVYRRWCSCQNRSITSYSLLGFLQKVSLINNLGMRFDDGCNLIHKCSCTAEFIKKLITVCKIGFKYYLLFHLIPLLLRLKKCKEGKKMLIILLKAIKEYIKSVLFMAFLVGGVKGSLCLSNYTKITLNGKY